MGPANGRRRYIITSSLTGWGHTQNDPEVSKVTLVEIDGYQVDNKSLGIYCLYSQSGRTSFRAISWCLEATRFDCKLFQSLRNLTGTSAEALSRCLSGSSVEFQNDTIIMTSILAASSLHEILHIFNTNNLSKFKFIILVQIYLRIRVLLVSWFLIDMICQRRYQNDVFMEFYARYDEDFGARSMYHRQG